MSLKSDVIIECNACHVYGGQLYEGRRIGCVDLVFRAGAKEALKIKEDEIVGYKNNRSSRAIVCEGEARTGKSLFASLFKRIAEVFVVDGRVLKKSRDPFSNMRKSTRIVLIEDLQQDYNIEYLFPNITGDWIIAKHNEYDVKLGFSESPKIIITTQASLVGKGASFTDRFLILKFSNHYHKAHNVVDDFGKIFFEEWDISDWKNTWDLIADCIHLYHQFGFVDNPDNAIP